VSSSSFTPPLGAAGRKASTGTLAKDATAPASFSTTLGVACLVCKGYPLLYPAGRIRLLFADGQLRAWNHWKNASSPEPSSIWFEIDGPCVVPGIEIESLGGDRRTHLFVRAHTMQAGDEFTVTVKPGTCPGCEGTGKFEDYARRRILGLIDGAGE
jgi:hypothetical protein